ncbi:hypothetical protein JNO12_12650 [Erwinia aphidicola]|nr:hypothetical protein [Erwinia aphidicola]
MKEKFTPGPWKVNEIGQHWNNKSLTHLEVTFGAYGECVCDTVYLRGDANLIAAAPDLIEALLRVRAQFSQAGISPIAGSLNPVEDNFAFINSAIDKALGESQ